MALTSANRSDKAVTEQRQDLIFKIPSLYYCHSDRCAI